MNDSIYNTCDTSRIRNQFRDGKAIPRQFRLPYTQRSCRRICCGGYMVRNLFPVLMRRLLSQEAKWQVVRASRLRSRKSSWQVSIASEHARDCLTTGIRGARALNAPQVRGIQQ